jgi:F420-0:gamma-glutamyl ligase
MSAAAVRQLRVAPDRHVTHTPPLWSEVRVGGVRWSRGLVATRWLEAHDDLADVLADVVAAAARPGDTVAVSEKVVVLLTGRTRDATAVRPGPLARFLARRVRPVGNSCGLSIPEKMQDVLDTLGRPRVVAATVLAGLTRPFGLRGVFFLVAGTYARDLDGMRPPYEGMLFPPLPVPVAEGIAADLEERLGVAVAVVDINDRGGSVRATSPGALDASTLAAVLADNPLGQRVQSTPVVLVRRRSGAAGSPRPRPAHDRKGRGAEFLELRRAQQPQREQVGRHRHHPDEHQ